MRSSECGCDLAEWLERLTTNAVVATVLGSLPASSVTVESKGRQMKQYGISYIKISLQPRPFGDKSSSSPQESTAYNFFSNVRITYTVLCGVVLAPLYCIGT
jgi:hypothetical protein